jgi:hypothetical protein
MVVMSFKILNYFIVYFQFDLEMWLLFTFPNGALESY